MYDHRSSGAYMRLSAKQASSMRIIMAMIWRVAFMVLLFGE